jgi:hypothetical protein
MVNGAGGAHGAVSAVPHSAGPGGTGIGITGSAFFERGNALPVKVDHGLRD